MSDMAPPRRRAWLGPAIAVLLLAMLPIVLTSSYTRGVLIVCAFNVLLATGLNLILGYAGQLNLGQSGFFAIGAYVPVILGERSGLGFWPCYLAGILCATASGAVLAVFASRLRGHYLGIASLGFAVITYQVLINWIDVTQGPLGIYGISPPPSLAVGGVSLDFHNAATFFYLIAGIALIVWLLLARLMRSPAGAALLAIREDEISAAALGINTTRWKITAFAIGAGVAGIAGGLFPGFVGTLTPDLFQITESFAMLAMVIVGGAGTMAGPVIGAIVLTVLAELLRGFGELRLLVYGVLLTLVGLFMPGGLSQLWQRVRVSRAMVERESA